MTSFINSLGSYCPSFARPSREFREIAVAFAHTSCSQPVKKVLGQPTEVFEMLHPFKHSSNVCTHLVVYCMCVADIPFVVNVGYTI